MKASEVHEVLIALETARNYWAGNMEAVRDASPAERAMAAAAYEILRDEIIKRGVVQ